MIYRDGVKIVYSTDVTWGEASFAIAPLILSGVSLSLVSFSKYSEGVRYSAECSFVSLEHFCSAAPPICLYAYFV